MQTALKRLAGYSDCITVGSSLSTLFVDIDQEMRRNSTNGARQEQNDLMTKISPAN